MRSVSTARASSGSSLAITASARRRRPSSCFRWRMASHSRSTMPASPATVSAVRIAASPPSAGCAGEKVLHERVERDRQRQRRQARDAHREDREPAPPALLLQRPGGDNRTFARLGHRDGIGLATGPAAATASARCGPRRRIRLRRRLEQFRLGRLGSIGSSSNSTSSISKTMGRRLVRNIVIGGGLR